MSSQKNIKLRFRNEDSSIYRTRKIWKVLRVCTCHDAQAWRSGTCTYELHNILVPNFPARAKRKKVLRKIHGQRPIYFILSFHSKKDRQVQYSTTPWQWNNPQLAALLCWTIYNSFLKEMQPLMEHACMGTLRAPMFQLIWIKRIF